MSADVNVSINHQNQRHTIKFTVSVSILRQDTWKARKKNKSFICFNKMRNLYVNTTQLQKWAKDYWTVSVCLCALKISSFFRSLFLRVLNEIDKFMSWQFWATWTYRIWHTCYSLLAAVVVAYLARYCS